MNDTSTLVALCSALIQGGATILAVLDGFLVGFGPVQRSGWASAIQAANATIVEADREVTKSEKFLETPPGHVRSTVILRLLTGNFSQKEAEAETQADRRPLAIG